MRILVDNGSYHLLNVGDVAMLQVTVERLNRLWPDATIEVITDRPDLLAEYCPAAMPLISQGRQWFRSRHLFGRFSRFVTRQRELQFKCLWPQASRRLFDWKARLKGRKNQKDINHFLEAVFDADLVVASGGGYITDAFKNHAISLLGELKTATRMGKYTVMFGQGIGPICDPELRAKVAWVLPSVDLIAVRESRKGLPLLNMLGVKRDRVIATGDDAIELAYKVRSTELGDGIGVNLRIASYSELDKGCIALIRKILHDFSGRNNAVLHPVPISTHEYDSDVRTIQELMEGYDDGSDAGRSLDSPHKVIKQIGNCRIVVTGSYHPAVFALAQGIPVIALAKSGYYIDKFLGVKEQFGGGCEMILFDKQLKENLIAGIERAWSEADQIRPQLLESAKRQVFISKAAYRRAFELVNGLELTDIE